jgi:glycosyltransferase involved in cell wall biosynthesis
MIDTITPIVLTFNEAPNIARTLDRLSWAKQIVVVDSGSTDATRAILARYPNVRVVERAFTTQGDQWQFALTGTGVTSEWVLALDADYVLTDEFVAELSSLAPPADVQGFWATFDYCIGGRRLRGAAYPPVIVLYRRAAAHYVDDGHANRVKINGRVEWMRGHVLHDDRKRMSAWLLAQSRYMRIEAEKIDTTPWAQLSWTDRSRKFIVVAPPMMFFYCYVFKGGALDGLAGFFYALQRLTAEYILALNLLERMLGLHDRPA